MTSTADQDRSPASRIHWLLAALTMLLLATVRATGADDHSPPASPVRLIFIHHSTGENWLSDGYGGLGLTLRDNNYFVSDTNYGWGPGSIGDRTDIPDWWTWFRGPQSAVYMDAVLGEGDQHCSYSRLAAAPQGPNRIVMFKSCFPNSALDGPLGPIPPNDENPMLGGSGSAVFTVANAKGLYVDILNYFASQPGTLFIAVTAPPLIDGTYAANARAFNEWLVNEWLSGYSLKNVFVFDFYNVLTSNGGAPGVSDEGQTGGNHHRWWEGAVQHKSDGGGNTLAYPSGDDHPNATGSHKATAEFVPLLNVAYHRWQSSSQAGASDGWFLYE